MDDLCDLQESEFITDTDDQDSLDEKIDSEQRLKNHQLWVSFQNAACCITQLYQDRSQSGISPWIPFQNAASNLTTLYRDCIESQKKFAKIGYQIGRRRRMRELDKYIKKRKLNAKNFQPVTSKVQSGSAIHYNSSSSDNGKDIEANDKISFNSNNISSILAVNQLNLNCDESSSIAIQQQARINSDIHCSRPSVQQGQNSIQQQQQQHQNQSQSESIPQNTMTNDEEQLMTFQQALAAQTSIRTSKPGQIRRPCLIQPGTQQTNRAIHESKLEEDRLLELNQFLCDEYHRHVGSRKRSCIQMGGNVIKRIRE